MLKEVKCRICLVKGIVILSGLLLIAVCAFAQAPEWQLATQAGGTGYDYGNGIALDYAENSYVTGYFFGAAIFGSCSLTSSGGSDIFVAKMDADGTWQWAAQAGGNDYDHGEAITIDDAGNCYVTGYFEGTATFGSYSLTSSGSYDIFVAKMDASGNWLWVNQAGGVSKDEGYGITIDDAANTYVTGYFYGTATFGLYSLTSSGSADIFVAKLNPPVSSDPEIKSRCVKSFSLSQSD